MKDNFKLTKNEFTINIHIVIVVQSYQKATNYSTI